MKISDIVFKVIILIIGAIVITFNVLLYNFCELQKSKLGSLKDKLDVEAEFNSNKFKYQSDQIERLNIDLENVQQQVKNQKEDLAAQKDALLQEAEKRHTVENTSKSIQTSLVDIEAEADAIKQGMKSWQKDYVSVLAELDKKIDDSQVETKNIETNLVALNIPELKENINTLKTDVEKITTPAPVATSVLPDPTAVPEKKVVHKEMSSQ